MTAPRVKDLIPIPPLEDTRRLLVVQAHPDDADIGAGATIAKLAAKGTDITLLTVTDGRVGYPDASVSPQEIARMRHWEAREAAHTLGITNQLLWLDFPDGGNLALSEVRAGITRAIRQVQPDTVMVMDPWLMYEAHSDHRCTGLATAEACLLAGFPHFCPADLEAGIKPHQPSVVAFYGTSRPNTFIDVTDTWDTKMAAIMKHESQFPEESREIFSAYTTAKARELAEGRGFELAEAFKVVTHIHLHFNVDTEHY